MPTELVVNELTHVYPGNRIAALDGVSFALAKGEILSIIGPSGGGKSTLLRLIAGLERPLRGSVCLQGRSLTGRPGSNGVPPERRAIGMVSQGGDLFPHLNVLNNVKYGLRRMPRKERLERAMRALEHVGLASLAKRFPAELSGGEAQRIALARALAPSPRVLLLDEPFSSLDSSLRDHLRQLTIDLLREAAVTAIFVTHHGDDALAIGDRIGVIREGRLAQLGTPRELWNSPASAEVAALLGPINVMPDGGSGTISLVRPQQLTISANPADRALSGTIVRSEFCGDHFRVAILLENHQTPVLVCHAADSPHQLGQVVRIARIP